MTKRKYPSTSLTLYFYDVFGSKHDSISETLRLGNNPFVFIAKMNFEEKSRILVKYPEFRKLLELSKSAMKEV